MVDAFIQIRLGLLCSGILSTVPTGSTTFYKTCQCPADLTKIVQLSANENVQTTCDSTNGAFSINIPKLVVPAPEIETSLGRLKGIALSSWNSKIYNAYYGIPYAKAPIGQLRFEPPVAAYSWNGILDATTAHEACPQIGQYSAIYEGIEDCLFVDVYTPEKAFRGSNFPVVFSIFGGQHKYGTTLRDGVSRLMDHDIIIVRVSYRLGVLGFLSTGDTVIPGNMGMKDQAMALRWTKENIYDFGGDPNRITLHGHSSGAACAHLLTLSPLSRDIYNQAIFQSGLGTSPHFFVDRVTATGITAVLAEKANCSIRSHEHLKLCLQNKTAQELVIAANKLSIYKKEPRRIFRPTVEDENVVGAFLVSHPSQTPYSSHSKPWIIGITTGDGSDFVESLGGSDHSFLGTKIVFPILGLYKWTTKLNHLNYIEQLTRTHFFNDHRTNNLTGLLKMFTGIMNGMPLLEAVQTYKGPKFVYLFDYKGLNKNAKEGFPGVKHSLDLHLIFSRPDGKNLTQEDKIFSEEMITRWVNFYYSGNPNKPFTINTTIFSAWDLMSSPRVEYLCISKSGNMEKDYFVNEYSWWKKVPYLLREE